MKNQLLFWKFFYCFLVYGFIQTGALFAEATSPDVIKKRLNTTFTKKTGSINLIETLLLISKDWDPALKEKPLRDKIDQLIASVKSQLRPESTAQETVNILRMVIYHEKKYRYTD